MAYQKLYHDYPKYGVSLPAQLNERELELTLFRLGWQESRGGLGRYGHFRRAADLIWPDVQWNPWLEDQIKSLCSDDHSHVVGESRIKVVNWAGCAAAGKTFGAGFFASVWWCADPLNSIVILTSTTRDMIRRRVWPVIQDFYYSARDKHSGTRRKMGHLLESRTALQAVKGDDKHSIFAQAVRDGETSKAVENIKGQHAPRILLVIDEATGTPEAIFQTIPNLIKGCQEFTLLVIGNPVSRLDPHGRCCEPADGWGGVTIDDTKWATKGVREWQIPPGICLHFDGTKSPNVLAGRTEHPYIFTYEDYLRSQEHDTGSLNHWVYDRGFWAPDNISNTVLTEAHVLAHDAMGSCVFNSWTEEVAALDPAFGGDGCVLRFGTIGDAPGGGKLLLLGDSHNIEVRADIIQPADYQIAHQVMDMCRSRGVVPARFAMDTTGTGRGVAAILTQEWGQIHRVEFGGAPSDLPAGVDDYRAAGEVFDRRVTELWFRCRELLVADRLKGLDRQTMLEFCAREYTIKARKIILEDKPAVKRKLGRSPDNADAAVVLVDLARGLGVVPEEGAELDDNDWQKFAQEQSAVYDVYYEAAQ